MAWKLSQTLKQHRCTCHCEQVPILVPLMLRTRLCMMLFPAKDMHSGANAETSNLLDVNGFARDLSGLKILIEISSCTALLPLLLSQSHGLPIDSCLSYDAPEIIHLLICS